MTEDRWDKRDDESYEAHAQRIVDAVGLRVTIVAGGPKCPRWGNDQGRRHCPYGRCNGFHGKRWRIGLVSRTGNSHVVSFWDSVANDMEPFKRPSVYEVLACLEWAGPTTPDGVVEEYGPMKPSQAIACAEQNRALRALLTGASGVYTNPRVAELLSKIR